MAVRFLASEHSTGVKHGGRIDTLGIDENGCPVIIEYKRALNENVINQGLYYLDWLMDHRIGFSVHRIASSGHQIRVSGRRIALSHHRIRSSDHRIGFSVHQTVLMFTTE